MSGINAANVLAPRLLNVFESMNRTLLVELGKFVRGIHAAEATSVHGRWRVIDKQGEDL
jgi:hypothetical protein